MLFSVLAKSCLEPALFPTVNDLLAVKMNTPELGEGKRIDLLNEYIDVSIAEIEELLNEYPSDEHKSWDEINNIFLQNLN